MSSKSILEDYKAELKYAQAWKAAGIMDIDASVAGLQVAAGRQRVPIDEYIAFWQNGITAMEAGADQELYNY